MMMTLLKISVIIKMHIIYLADEAQWIGATLTVQTCLSCLQKIMSEYAPTL